jgi:flagellar biosynthesis protein FlhG
LVDAELDDEHGFPLGAMAGGDIVVQVGPGAASIKEGYGIVKRLNAWLGKRPFGILVTGASESEAKVIYKNMEQAASRYLAVPLYSVGFVPADEHVKRAARTGKAVIDAFPLAGASAAFRQLAGQFAVSMEKPAMFRGRSPSGADIRT